MNSILFKRLQKALLNQDGNKKEISSRLIRLYINKECINFCKKLIFDIKDNGQRELILLELKALLREINRAPDPIEYQFNKPEFNHFFREIKAEQEACEPIKWIDAQLELLRFHGQANDTTIDYHQMSGDMDRLLTAEEVMLLCKISKSTLDRWIASGLNVSKPNQGRKRYFTRAEVIEWQRQAD